MELTEQTMEEYSWRERPPVLRAGTIQLEKGSRSLLGRNDSLGDMSSPSALPSPPMEGES